MEWRPRGTSIEQSRLQGKLILLLILIFVTLQNIIVDYESNHSSGNLSLPPPHPPFSRLIRNINIDSVPVVDRIYSER